MNMLVWSSESEYPGRLTSMTSPVPPATDLLSENGLVATRRVIC